MPMRKGSEDKLLDAVDDVVFAQGVENASVDAVLARAGVSAATLYRGFDSKEALIAAALERRHRRWREAWEQAVAAAPDDRQRLLAIFDAIDAFGARPDGARWCAFLGAAATYPHPAPDIAAAIGRDTDHLRTRLRELTAALPVDDPDGVAESLLVVVTGELAMRLRDPRHRSSGTGRRIAATLIEAAAVSAQAGTLR